MAVLTVVSACGGNLVASVQVYNGALVSAPRRSWQHTDRVIIHAVLEPSRNTD